MVVYRSCNLPMEPDYPEELPDPYVKCYLNPGPFVALSNLLLHRNCCTSRMMAELKFADDIQDPRLEEPVNDMVWKEKISPSEPPLVLLTSSEERKRKRQGTKRKRNGPTIPKQSKSVEGHNCGTCGIHAGGKLHQCKVCRKCFTKSGGLKNHIRIHTGDKPFECKVCAKCFNTSSSL
ncbi:unnamed protein product, partial [Cyprideis torosa]